MWTYVIRRLLLFVPTLIGASILIVLMRLVPGDIAEILVYQTSSQSSPSRSGRSSRSAGS
jgi:ABC-type microcin C transport system permease subunit YejB